MLKLREPNIVVTGYDRENLYFNVESVKRKDEVEPETSGMSLPDIKDLPFYDLGLEASKKGAYLVTGNIKHFPSDTFIVTPRQFIEMLNEKMM